MLPGELIRDALDRSASEDRSDRLPVSIFVIRRPHRTYERAATWEEAHDSASRAHWGVPEGVSLELVHMRRAYEDDWGTPERVYLSLDPDASVKRHAAQMRFLEGAYFSALFRSR
ncbi:hypothetical protein ABZ746_34185 [Streptomyces sp. NPDC020096]